MKGIILVLIVWIVREFAHGLPSSYPLCRTRDSCIRLTECKPYMNLFRSLKRPLSTASIRFLRQQECGFDGTYPLVCCFPTDNGSTMNNLASEDSTRYLQPPLSNLEDYDESAHLPQKPDFTLSDLSDYRVGKQKLLIFSMAHASTTPATTSTEKTKPSRLTRQQLSQMWGFLNTPKPMVQKKETKTKRDQQLRRKMEEVNRAFTHMDYFFVGRMQDDKTKNSKS